MMKAAIYARLAAPDKDEMDKQISELKAAVAQHQEWELCGVYFEFVSGMTEDMPYEMNHLLADCKANDVHIVVIRDISRLTRNYKVLSQRIEAFRSAGIELYLLNEDMQSLSQLDEANAFFDLIKGLEVEQ